MSSYTEIQTHKKKGPWSREEDEKLKAYMTTNGVGNWNSVSRNARLERDGRSCRLRWYNHLHPDVKKGPFSEEEVQKFFELLIKLGGKFKWCEMAFQLPGRSDNAIKNFWNARKRKYEKLGESPYSHNTRHADADDSNMLYSDVGSTSISNHIAPTSIDVVGIQTSYTPPMAMVSDLFSFPQFSFIQPMDCPQIPSPEETQYQYQMLESNFPENDGLLESISKKLVTGGCSYATPMYPSEINLIDERGKKPISLENDVEANHDDLMDTDLLFDYFSYDKDNNNDMLEKLPNNVKDTLDAVIYGKNFHK